MFRTIANHEMAFCEELPPNFYVDKGKKEQIHNSFELEESLRRQIEEAKFLDLCENK
ncbi:MAG: hypothetical protein NC419_02815 [Muribaculaceae bacterium]|nr:hypothetical protein [Muribaculaceae bacterium]